MTSCRLGLRSLTRPFSTSSPSPSSIFSPSLNTNTTTHQPATQIPHLSATRLSCSTNKQHVELVSSHLANQGMLKVTLDFPDPESHYLQSLIISLSQIKHHAHKLPVSHSASRGWFWDVRPSQHEFQTADHQARSETMSDFPWHTDCSYEELVPRYIALHVLQHDRFGGGTFSIMSVARLLERLPPSTQRALQQPHFKISVPREFIKDPARDHIVGKVVTMSSGRDIMRLRQDILSPLTSAAERALEELHVALQSADINEHAAVHLGAESLPTGSVVLLDNRRWLHARDHVRDPERHLRRVRWDAKQQVKKRSTMLLHL